MASEQQGKSRRLLRFTDMSSSSVDKATLPTHVPLGKKKRLQEFMSEANLGPKTYFSDITDNEVDENTEQECLPIQSEEVVKQEVRLEST